jgi:hypothetical protein
LWRQRDCNFIQTFTIQQLAIGFDDSRLWTGHKVRLSILDHCIIVVICFLCRSAHACARYLSVTQCLRTLNLNDNLFSLEDTVTIIRALANRGPKGSIDTVTMQDQFPSLTVANIRAAHQYGTSLGLRVESKSGMITWVTMILLNM